MKKILIILSVLMAVPSFANNVKMLEGTPAKGLFDYLDSISSKGEVVIRAVALTETWSADSHGIRLFSPDLSYSCTESFQRNGKGDSGDYYYCEYYETPDLIDWESPMQEGKSIYREI